MNLKKRNPYSRDFTHFFCKLPSLKGPIFLETGFSQIGLLGYKPLTSHRRVKFDPITGKSIVSGMMLIMNAVSPVGTKESNGWLSYSQQVIHCSL